MRVIDCVGVGRAQATTAERLAEMCGLTAREVSRQVERARKDGIPVCASTVAGALGYYLAGSADELARYLESLDRRLKSMRTTRQRLQSTLDRMEGQEALWGA
jgi:uncharacterized membrane protein